MPAHFGVKDAHVCFEERLFIEESSVKLTARTKHYRVPHSIVFEAERISQ